MEKERRSSRSTINADHETHSEVAQLRVNRDTDLRIIADALLCGHGNVFLYGERGIGKTFLLRLLLDELHDDVSSSAFPFMLSVPAIAVPFSMSGNRLGFMTCFALQMLASAWRTVLGQRHLRLLSRRRQQDLRTLWEEKSAAITREIYREIRDLANERLFSSEVSIGANAVLKGELKHKEEEKQVAQPSLPHEVLGLIEEFRFAVLGNLGLNRIIALCDEANVLPDEWQQDILQGFETLAHIDVQFVFVAGFVPGASSVSLPHYFEYAHELKGLSPEFSAELLDKRFAPLGVSFMGEALSMLIDEARGNPRTLLSIATNAMSLSDSREDPIAVPAARMEAAIENHRRFVESAQQAMREQTGGS